MLNRVVLVGRLTRDPDLRYTPNGKAVANFTIAVNRPFSNQQGDREADFINCVIWNKPAENLANYMSKGNLIGIDGNLQSRSYDNKDGQRVYVTEVIAGSVQFLESKNKSASNNQENNNQTNSYQNNNQNTNQSQRSQSQNNSANNNAPPQQHEQLQPIDISDDDLPF